MYHDQGHVPVKTLGFTYDEAAGAWTGLSGVNVTVGLPFLRVSVDHGTAFDRAWKGIANPESMVEALDVAVRMLAAGRGATSRVMTAPRPTTSSPSTATAP